MQVPVLARSNIILALAHHLSLPNALDAKCIPKFGSGESPERTFAIIIGLDSKKVGQLFEILDRYVEEKSNKIESRGLTPKLFIAAILKLYGFSVKETIIKGFEKLEGVERQLGVDNRNIDEVKGNEAAGGVPAGLVSIRSQGSLDKLDPSDINKELLDLYKEMNKTLMELTNDLAGVRSMVSYVSKCAQGLVLEASAMKTYVEEERRRTGWDGSLDARERALKALDSVAFEKRDNDKLNMIFRAMKQYELDIKSLKDHVMVDLGLVSQLYFYNQV